MPKLQSREVHKRPLDTLPPQRADIYFDEVSPSAIETLIRERVMILKGVVNEGVAESIRADSRKFLLINSPPRIFRKAIERVLPGMVDHFPPALRRRPLRLPIDSPKFSGPTRFAFDLVQGINGLIHDYPKIKEMYKGGAVELNNAVFSRAPKGMWFPRHQDSFGIRGIGYAIQTSPTLWHVEPSLTVEGGQDFTFQTQPGDVVVLLERARDFDLYEEIQLGAGFTEFEPGGSVVHSGLNLDSQYRYGLNLFNVERDEL